MKVTVAVLPVSTVTVFTSVSKAQYGSSVGISFAYSVPGIRPVTDTVPSAAVVKGEPSTLWVQSAS